MNLPIRSRTLQWSSCTLVLLLGCYSTSGAASAKLIQPGANKAAPVSKAQTISFVWKSEAGAPEKGAISVMLPDGKRYAGMYRQVTHKYDSEYYAPMWTGWDPYWTRWSVPWDRNSVIVDGDTWVTVYTDRVVARLNGPNQENMRCRFTLDEPESGMAGGGIGDCQLSNGLAVKDAVLHDQH